MSNFTFIQADFPSLYHDALEAEKLILVSPTAAAILCRSSLENAVNWLYDHDASLTRPWRADLSTLLHDQNFREQFPQSLFREINLVRKTGNAAAHGSKIKAGDSLASLKYLFRFMLYLNMYYGQSKPLSKVFDEALIPNMGQQADQQKMNQQQLLDLQAERATIKERIDRINESLVQIDYVEGRYITLVAQAAMDAEIQGFQQDMKACTENSVTGSENNQYSEDKFLQVQKIIARFRGREGELDGDARWLRKVTDVRNWFRFAASERWREDDTEYEHYADSGGKSGGQKEKLAYTILAASLAYQFGLEWNAVRSRSFRFVVIDEAFGRGSDESAEYGLRLFAQLNLQLLIVTPLQKIHIIEPHVQHVGYVSNDGGISSKLRNLSIETYRQEKQRETEM